MAIQFKTKDIGPEDRYIVIGRIKETMYSVVITYRKDKVRLISVRRSRKKEAYYYEKNELKTL